MKLSLFLSLIIVERCVASNGRVGTYAAVTTETRLRFDRDATSLRRTEIVRRSDRSRVAFVITGQYGQDPNYYSRVP